MRWSSTTSPEADMDFETTAALIAFLAAMYAMYISFTKDDS